MEIISARTNFSGIVYWVTFALLLMSVIWKVNFTWGYIVMGLAVIDTPVAWHDLIPVLLSPVPILLAAAAQFLRSGATIWLVGVVAVQLLPTVAMNNAMHQLDNAAFYAKLSPILFVALCAILVPYIFLIRSDELRKP